MSRLGEEIIRAIAERGPKVRTIDIQISVSGTKLEIIQTLLHLKHQGLVSTQSPCAPYESWDLTPTGQVSFDLLGAL